MPTPATIRKDDYGNSINDAGWEIQAIPAKDTRKFVRREKTRSGRSVGIHGLSFKPAERVVPKAISPYASEHSEWIIVGVIEWSGKDDRVFCYQYTAQPVAKDVNIANGAALMLYGYRLCDHDGDGKFESKEDALRPLIVPEWVR